MPQIRDESLNILEFCFKAELSRLFSQERLMKDGGELLCISISGWRCASWTGVLDRRSELDRHPHQRLLLRFQPAGGKKEGRPGAWPGRSGSATRPPERQNRPP